MLQQRQERKTRVKQGCMCVIMRSSLSFALFEWYENGGTRGGKVLDGPIVVCRSLHKRVTGS